MVTKVVNEKLNEEIRIAYDDLGQRVSKKHYKNSNLLKATIYVGDASGSVMSIYEHNSSNLKQLETPVYGAGRTGVASVVANAALSGKRALTEKYELIDHLGNVRAVVARDVSSKYFSDYFPFGMAMPQRKEVTDNNYRFGYQGQEYDADDPLKKEAFQLRLWDSRIGRWLTTDPKGQYSSPYMAMGNNPVTQVDPDGAWHRDANGNLVADPGDLPSQMMDGITEQFDYATEGLGTLSSENSLFGLRNTQFGGKQSFDYWGATGDVAGIVGGSLETFAGVVGEPETFGLSTFLIIDGSSRVALNSAKLATRFANVDSKLTNAFPTSIGGVLGKGIDIAGGGSFYDVGRAELTLGFANDIISIASGGGNGGAIRALLEKPTNLGNVSKITRITALSYDNLNNIHRTSRFFTPVLNYQTLYNYGR